MTTFDKGATINQRAAQLQRVAAEGLSEADSLTALGTATGKEVAAMVKRHPNLSVSEMLELAYEGMREQAFIAAGLSSDDTQELTEEEFKELVIRIIRIVAANTRRHDALGALAQALGTLINVTARSGDYSATDMLKICQETVASYAHEVDSR